MKKKKRSNLRTARPLPKFTEQFANLRRYFQETSARYNNATSREERKHLLAALKEITEQAHKLIAKHRAEHSAGSDRN